MSNLIGSSIKSVKWFFEVGLWKTRLSSVSRTKAFFIRLLRILFITIREFRKDNCPTKAAALSSYTLLSIVPVVALVFAIAKGFEFDVALRAELDKYFVGQEEVKNYIYSSAENMISNAKGGAIAGVSLIVLFYTVVRLFHNVEEAFNEIWNSERDRTWLRKFTDYSLLVIVAPILILFSSGLNFFLSTQLENLSDQLWLINIVSSYLLVLLDYLPFALVWILFSLFYLIVPNTNVKVSAAVLAGVISGTTYLILQTAYFKFQIGFSQYNAIYGSLVALPLLIIWIQLSWIILLIGAELGSAHQYIDSYQFETKNSYVNPYMNRALSVNALHLIATNFKDGRGAITVRVIGDRMQIPHRFVKSILKDLTLADLVTETIPKEGESGFLPSRDIADLNLSYVLNQLDHRGNNDLSFDDGSLLPRVYERLNSIAREIETSKQNINILEV